MQANNIHKLLFMKFYFQKENIFSEIWFTVVLNINRI